MTSSHFSARPIPLLLWTSIAKVTFLSLSLSLLGLFSFSSILYALSDYWAVYDSPISMVPRLHGTREQPKWQVSRILSGKIESKINFKVQRSRTLTDESYSSIGHFFWTISRQFVSQPVTCYLQFVIFLNSYLKFYKRFSKKE